MNCLIEEVELFQCSQDNPLHSLGTFHFRVRSPMFHPVRKSGTSVTTKNLLGMFENEEYGRGRFVEVVDAHHVWYFLRDDGLAARGPQAAS